MEVSAIKTEGSIRAFLAVPLSDEVRAEVVAVEGRLRERWPHKVKWVEGQNLHVTLKFLGQIEMNQVERISELITEIVSNFKSFQVCVEGLGSFPSARRPRVLWCGISQGGQELSDLATALENGLTKLGFEAEGRFHPHITLGRARSRGSVSLEEWESEGPKPRCMLVERVLLMRSILGKEGPTYQVLKEFTLASSH